MARKKFKVYYFYPVGMVLGKEKIFNLKPILEGLEKIKADKRIIEDGEGNIQLKSIKYNEQSKRWYLAFLRNQIDAPFKTKLDDATETAESLDEDEFVGQECCVIYDECSKILSLQNNRGSVSFNGINKFLMVYTEDKFELKAITYKEKYCEISDDELIRYKSIIIGYTDISELMKLSEQDDDEILGCLGKISSDVAALSGKIELSVGRAKSFLQKNKLKDIVRSLKNNEKCTKSLKVKMVDHDTIRLIDLLNNKVSDDCQISITKNDPKTFKKIFDSMDSAFDSAIDETFDKCNKFINE